MKPEQKNNENKEKDYRIATEEEKNEVMTMEMCSFREKFLGAPIIVEDSVVYAVVGGIAYPLKELAENSQ